MRRLVCLVTAPSLIALAPSAAVAQEPVPVVRARSKIADIVDGNHVKKAYWLVMPERKPDLYFVEVPRRPHRVTFRTDLDSISFDTHYGDVFNFVVALSNGDSARTQVRAQYRQVRRSVRACTSCTSTVDSIPFSIGDNNKIYLKGVVNTTDTVRLQFDLGSGGSIIKKAAAAGTHMRFDGTMNLLNSDGNNVVRTSSANRLQIANLVWDSTTFTEADNLTKREEGLVGNTLFQDKVVEINYDIMRIIVRDSLPELTAAYARYDAVLDGGVVPFVQASLKVGDSTYTDWYMFDTGNSGSLTVSGAIAQQHNLFGAMQTIFPFRTRTVALLPALNVGSHDFDRVITVLQKPRAGDQGHGLLGNAILKRFNVILDNRNGDVYLKPNTLMNAPYSRSALTASRTIKGAAVLAVALTGYLLLRRRQ